ncbi:uncharacterized protein BYT42DRAFT_578524 [Radiomyces spectabilis]|uniref:uncharacterized protein n=1 Tax=Radiomyces spectabilis TaxID=64574 RepID=UPI00221E8697|nr:uncharacterized protein BYT42DRAFT_578524 [Radiomyces spectabilis]KAI8372911.1 hypothetical protein BYT42DRAFT_578524 [Radiomyces spectabilis]
MRCCLKVANPLVSFLQGDLLLGFSASLLLSIFFILLLFPSFPPCEEHVKMHVQPTSPSLKQRFLRYLCKTALPGVQGRKPRPTTLPAYPSAKSQVFYRIDEGFHQITKPKSMILPLHSECKIGMDIRQTKKERKKQRKGERDTWEEEERRGRGGKVDREGYNWSESLPLKYSK